jgi:NAD(P)-dependent dehydrogenase (short-subunit alcohol dehydrogenase family)
MMRLFDLSGKVAVITGATGALGQSMAGGLAECGCDIILATRSREKGALLAAKLKADFHVDVIVLAWDALNVASIKQLALDAAAWQGHIDILINNAGGNRTTSAAHFFDRSDDDIKIGIELNLTSPLYCCREFGRIMKKQGFGKIINIASIAGLIGRDRRMYRQADVQENLVDYNAAKGGIIAMTRDLAALLAPYGVQVNAISPGGFRHGTSDSFAALYANRTPAGYMGRTATDLQGAAVFLASSASDYVVGHNLVVDGGFTIWQ